MFCDVELKLFYCEYFDVAVKLLFQFLQPLELVSLWHYHSDEN